MEDISRTYYTVSVQIRVLRELPSYQVRQLCRNKMKKAKRQLLGKVTAAKPESK